MVLKSCAPRAKIAPFKPILIALFDTPFGRTFVFRDPDGYAVAIHGAGQWPSICARAGRP